MVMEASPSPQSVGREFVRQYYTLLNKAPTHLHRFYNNFSSFVHGGLDAPNRETLPVVGQKQIHNRIQQLNFQDCHAKISQVDAQATLGNGVVVQVTGELSNGGAPMRRFTQTFVLAAQSPKKYYVHNDIFRYQDIVFFDEESSGSGRSEGEEEETGGAGYFPSAPALSAFAVEGPGAAAAAPPAVAPPTAAPPPAPPVAPDQPAPQPTPDAPPHVNGHPHHDETATAHLVTALQGTNISVAEREPEVEEPEPVPEPVPEPPREPTPPPPVVAAPPEPKTYANLLKSGGGHTRASPPAAASASAPAPAHAPAAASTPAPAPPPQEQRARPPRPHHANTGEGGAGGGRRYSESQQLFLGKLPAGATEQELRALFAKFGPVAELRVHAKPDSRTPNYGFITYHSAQAALDCLHAPPTYFPADSPEGVKLNVEEKKARNRDLPRRRALSGQRQNNYPRHNYRR